MRSAEAGDAWSVELAAWTQERTRRITRLTAHVSNMLSSAATALVAVAILAGAWSLNGAAGGGIALGAFPVVLYTRAVSRGAADRIVDRLFGTRQLACWSPADVAAWICAHTNVDELPAECYVAGGFCAHVAPIVDGRVGPSGARAFEALVRDGATVTVGELVGVVTCLDT